MSVTRNSPDGAANPINRRDFIKRTTLVSASLALGASLGGPDARAENVPPTATSTLPRRPYGRAQIPLSVVGFGGMIIKGAEQADANRIVAEAVERGVNYFDVAPSYGDAEIKMGPAIQPYRDRLFLAGKTGERTDEGAAAELRQSLDRLQTDHLDLYQLHALTDLQKDVDVAFGKGGAMETLIQAKASGQVRHLGFSAHSVEAALAALDRHAFDSILFPVNFTAYFKGQFGESVIAKARAQGVTVLALKAMARQSWPAHAPEQSQYAKCWYQPLTDRHQAALAVRFTLSQPVAAFIPPGEESLFRLALELAADERPITEAEVAHLQSLAKDLNPLFRNG